MDQLIDKNIFIIWNALKKHGDGQRIIDANPWMQPNHVARAFKSGRCKEKVFNAINDFYKKRATVN